MKGKNFDIFIVDEIDDDSPARLRKELSKIPSDAPIDVHINSTGGAVAAGCAMANMLAVRKGLTRGFVDGLCCSIATQIFFSCRRRFMHSNTFLMLHSPSLGTNGNARELRKSADDLDVIQTGLESTYLKAARKGVTAEQIHALVENETWLSAADAANIFDITVLDAVAAHNLVAATQKLQAKGFAVPDVLARASDLQLDAARRALQAELDACDKFLPSINERIDEKMSVEKNSLQNEYVLTKRAFNKALKNQAHTLTPDETPFAPDAADNGYLFIPDQQLAAINQKRQLFPALKDFCRVFDISVPNSDWQQWFSVSIDNKFLPVSTAAIGNTPTFNRISFDVKDFILQIPISNNVFADFDFDLADVLGVDIAREMVSLENRQIVDTLFNLPANSINSYFDLLAAICDLPPHYFQSAIVITNQSGAFWLRSLLDSVNHPIFAPSDPLVICGKHVVILPEDVLPTVDNSFPVFIGSLFDFAIFFDRKAYEIKAADGPLFNLNGTVLRLFTRFAVAVDKSDSMFRFLVSLN